MKMKFLTFALVALLAALAFSTPANAQNGVFAPYVNAGISMTGTGSALSTSNPDFNVGGGIESSSKHLLLDVNVQFNSANVTSLGNIINSQGGYSETATGSAYYKLGGFLLGGGAFYSNQIASGTTAIEGLSSFNRNQVRPFVGGGFQTKYNRLLVNYVLPGKDTVAGANTNGLNDRTFNVSNEFFLGKTGLKKHLRLTQSLQLTSSNTSLAQEFTGSGLRAAGVTAGAGVKFVF